ncbi:MAG TPA: hypothetical protein VF838_01810 [Trebonia sp.]
MSRTKAAVSGAPLLVAVVLAIGGCGSSGGTTTAASQQATGTAGSGPASAANGTGGGNAVASCSHGLQAGAAGVVDIECDGPATIHITAGSVSDSITGGTCRRADSTWTVTAGVVTQYGVYDGPPVNVVSVAATVGKDASIQGELGGKMLLVDSASFALSAGGKSAHLVGTSNRNADISNTRVIVDVTC